MTKEIKSVFINLNLNAKTTMDMELVVPDGKVYNYLVGIYPNGVIQDNLLTSPISLDNKDIGAIKLGDTEIIITKNRFIVNDLSFIENVDDHNNCHLDNNKLKDLKDTKLLLFHFEPELNISDAISPDTSKVILSGRNLNDLLLGSDDCFYSYVLDKFATPYSAPSMIECDDGGISIRAFLDKSLKKFMIESTNNQVSETVHNIDDCILSIKFAGDKYQSAGHVEHKIYGETTLHGDIIGIVLQEISLGENEFEPLFLPIDPKSLTYSNLVDIKINDGKMIVHLSGYGEYKGPYSIIATGENRKTEVKPNGDVVVHELVNYSKSPFSIPKNCVALAMLTDVTSEEEYEKLTNPDKIMIHEFNMLLRSYPEDYVSRIVDRKLNAVNEIKKLMDIPSISIKSYLDLLDKLHPGWQKSYPVLASKVEDLK